jgi:hypothetical protein
MTPGDEKGAEPARQFVREFFPGFPARRLPDDGCGDEDSYNAGWNDCRLACHAAFEKFAADLPPRGPDSAREALADALSDVTIARATIQDSVETHGTHGGWLDEERERLSRAEDTLRAALASLK